MAGLYILAPESSNGMFAYRKDWDSLPEKSQRFGEDVEATEVAGATGATAGSEAYCDPPTGSETGAVTRIRLPNG